MKIQSLIKSVKVMRFSQKLFTLMKTIKAVYIGKQGYIFAFYWFTRV